MTGFRDELLDWAATHFPDAGAAQLDDMASAVDAYLAKDRAAVFVNTDKQGDAEPDMVLRLPATSPRNPRNHYFTLNRSNAYLGVLLINPVTAKNNLDRDDLKTTGTLLQDETEVHRIRHQNNAEGPYVAHTLGPHFLPQHLLHMSNTHLDQIGRIIFPALGHVSEYDSYDYFDDDHPLHAAHTDLKERLRAFERREMRGAVREFLAGLDQHALTIMRRGHVFHGDLAPANIYEWLTGFCEYDSAGGHVRERGPAADADVIAHRQALAEKYPGLLYTFLRTGWDYPEVQKLIDSGADDITAVRAVLMASHYGRNWAEEKRDTPLDPAALYPDEFIKYMRGKTRLNFDGLHLEANPFIRNCSDSFALAALLPRDWRPQTPAQWKEYGSGLSRLVQFARSTGRPLHDVVHEFGKLAGQDSGPLQELFSFSGATRQERIAQIYHNLSTGGHFGDFLEQATIKIVVPAIAQFAQTRGYPLPEDAEKWTKNNPFHDNTLGGRIAERIFHGFTMTKMFNQGVRWHSGKGFRVARRSNTLEGQYSWPGLFAPMERSGVSYRPLTATQELMDKAEEYDNCVHGYTRACTVGNNGRVSHVIEMRSPTGAVSLLELAEAKDAETGRTIVEIVQIEKPWSEHRAQNGQGQPKADRWAWEAARELVKTINEPGQTLIDWEPILSRREEIRANITEHDLNAAVGFDPFDAAKAENAYQALRFEMPKLFEQPTLKEFLDAKGITALLEQEFPEQKQKRGRHAETGPRPLQE